jgi:pyruvate dehydrogenase E1 component alpha subunit
MPAVKVDGTDFFAVYEAAREAVERGRAGGGPSAIEATAKRFFGHFEGDPQLYRSTSEREAARAADCLKLFRQRVLETGLLEPAQMYEIDNLVADEVEAAASSARAAPFPAASELLTDVYVSY